MSAQTLRLYYNVAVSLGLLFSGIFLAARLYTKARIVKDFRWEDYTCILGFASYCAWSAMKFKVTNAGGGTHQWNLTVQELSDQYRFSNYADILYSLAACFTKISIILLVLRIFCPQIHDRFYWVLQFLNVLNTSFYICYFTIPIAECRPREKIWHRKQLGTCLNIFVLYDVSSTFNALSDVAMFFVPLWRIWNLHVSRSRKLGVSAIFFSRALAVAASIIRLYFGILLSMNADYSYVKEQASIWTHAEISFGIICSCLFVLPRLYRHLASIPPYGSDEYIDYQRRKSSGGWYEPHSRSKGRKGSEKRVRIAGIDTDIETPPVPVKSWLESGTVESDRSPQIGNQAWALHWDRRHQNS